MPGSSATTLTLSIVAIFFIYVLSGLLNLGVPDSGARYPASRIHAVALVRDFERGNRTLWRDPGAPPFDHFRGCAVRDEEAVGIVGIARQQPRDALGHARVAGERRMLGAGEFEAAQAERQHGGARSQRHGGQKECFVHGFEVGQDLPVYNSFLTAR
ncbi:hypothetical protein SAMN05444679_11562 [Variovorax sp. CF079]|uniref:hypothetical protein n=1 Tax=Variovorax sp. CF079 TaxID=1882774 RepID=UPI0008870922|nr:hypothetical protein [Variovorax sp. CF079]SDD92625.1 hypothetical protein SAMN05444679_11562 [Variovorax sp. CF079]